MTLKELMNGHLKAEILCLYRGEVVRRLTVEGDTLKFDHLEGTRDLALDTELMFEPWCMDRGNILFNLAGFGMAKFCTEADVIRFEDGTRANVVPDKSWKRYQRNDSFF